MDQTNNVDSLESINHIEMGQHDINNTEIGSQQNFHDSANDYNIDNQSIANNSDENDNHVLTRPRRDHKLPKHLQDFVLF